MLSGSEGWSGRSADDDHVAPPTEEFQRGSSVVQPSACSLYRATPCRFVSQSNRKSAGRAGQTHSATTVHAVRLCGSGCEICNPSNRRSVMSTAGRTPVRGTCVKTNKCTNYSFKVLIMYDRSYIFRHYIAILRKRSYCLLRDSPIEEQLIEYCGWACCV
jgi:hypothetical protein